MDERCAKLETAAKLWYVAAREARGAARLISAGVLVEVLDTAAALTAEYDGVVSALPPATANLRLLQLCAYCMRLGRRPACSCSCSYLPPSLPAV